MTRNMDDLFRQTAQHQPDHLAVIRSEPHASISYRELDEAIQAASEQLSAAGLQKGECVGLHYPSSLEYIICNYAVWRCGGCVVPIPVELAADEKGEICRQIRLDYVITQKRAAEFILPFRQNGGCNLLTNATIIPIRSPREHPLGFQEINAAFIRFTSGTTGSSKGIVLSHESIYERICAANDVLEIGPSDRVLWVLSMSYHFTVSIVAYLTLGATIVLPADHFAEGILTAIKGSAATLLYASPMHYALLAEFPQAAPQKSLRLAISTTSSLERGVAMAFQDRFELPISQALGIIEVGLPCINVGLSAQRWDSVGRVLPAYELQLEDSELGPDAKEVLFRGPGFLDAYYAPWQARRQILHDGWFRTGDVGSLDENGCLILRGRSKEIISVMGMKFFPQEVETVLASHPDVAGVSVFARRHSRLGEAAHASVVPKRGLKEGDLEARLRQYCRQHLASYKVPERIELVQSLPRTASGKVLHRSQERVASP